MKKNTYIITVVACLISYTSFAQTKFEKFDSKEFYTEYVEPLNGIELGTGEVNDLINMSLIPNKNKIGTIAINNYKNKEGLFDRSSNIVSGVVQRLINILENNIEDCMDWMEILDEHKNELPKEYYNKRMKEIDESIAINSTAKTYYETLL